MQISMDYIRFYNAHAHSTGDLASLVDSPLVPSESLESEPASPTESTDSILVPEMQRSKSVNLSKIVDEPVNRCELLNLQLLVNDETEPIKLRSQMRLLEAENPEFICYSVKRANRHVNFIETTVNRYNINGDVITTRGFETFKDSRWLYMQYDDDQMRCTLEHQLYSSKRLHFNELTSPYVAVNFHMVTSYNGMFASLTDLEEITIEKFDTSKVTSMEEMFKDCINLKSITIIGCDLSAVTTMANFCRGCRSLKKLHFINCKYNLTCNYWNMLYGCHNIDSIKIPRELLKPIIDGTPEKERLWIVWEKE
jgi:surface protein